ncbi:MAG: LptE family protein [Elusimicrobia bacterium]|nr:LptE family protein [Elusimicrobiota bacterium]
MKRPLPPRCSPPRGGDSRLLLALLTGLAACGSDIAYRPAAQILPSNIKKISIRHAVNKTQQFGLEDKFTLRVRDEFLRDGRYPIVPEPDADGIVWITIGRYILTPIQHDANLIPTAYKLRIVIDLQFVDRAAGSALWEEKNLEGISLYPASTLPGGKSEEQAREDIWDTLARDVVKRVIEGFGSVTGSSEKRVSSEGPSTPPVVTPGKDSPPVNPNPY